MKKLRYYARFIVVCLLLKKMKLVRDLVRELSKNIGNFVLEKKTNTESKIKMILFLKMGKKSQKSLPSGYSRFGLTLILSSKKKCSKTI